MCNNENRKHLSLTENKILKFQLLLHMIVKIFSRFFALHQNQIFWSQNLSQSLFHNLSNSFLIFIVNKRNVPFLDSILSSYNILLSIEVQQYSVTTLS